ncbi:MAG: hypothetical protein DRN04_11615 [Thermoprotei archaeon]|nr:MAG: hypothetical protein DRN04_11615 [Thermoprotei archaeon]
MNRRMKIKISLVIAATLALLLVNAAVFTYYPVAVTVTGVQPVVFAAGSNAGKPDLGDGNTIVVTLGANGTSASITVHPTYQTTYYKDVLRLQNQDSEKSYYVAIRVNDPAELEGASTATLRIYDSTGTLIDTVDLTTTGTTDWIAVLNAEDYLRFDLKFYIEEETSLPSSETIGFEVIYSPQNVESAP